jgi:hypothetical protein
MSENWERKLSCAAACRRCGRGLGARDERILSVVDHEPICMPCKREEEQRPDYAEIAKEAIGRCLVDVELAQQDPGGWCYHHFYPFTCR